MKELKRFGRNRTAVFGLVITLLLAFTALFAPVIAPRSYKEQNLPKALTPPFWHPDGDMSYPLGTDHLGRDVLTRIIYGMRISFAVGVGAVLIGGTFGTVIGVVSGFFGGKVDGILMRLADTQLSFPAIFLAIAVIAVLGRGLLNLIAVLGFVTWVQYARVARGGAFVVKEQEFVEAAHAIGANSFHIITRHILPNVMPPILVIATVNVSTMILSEAGLSFLGLGVQPPTPTLGQMLSEGRHVFSIAWWNAVFPGVAIMLVVLGINLLGDGLAEVR
jgi:peptide/nickel transport system permease protein